MPQPAPRYFSPFVFNLINFPSRWYSTGMIPLSPSSRIGPNSRSARMFPNYDPKSLYILASRHIPRKLIKNLDRRGCGPSGYSWLLWRSSTLLIMLWIRDEGRSASAHPTKKKKKTTKNEILKGNLWNFLRSHCSGGRSSQGPVVSTKQRSRTTYILPLVHQLTTVKFETQQRIHDVETRNDYIEDHGWLASYPWTERSGIHGSSCHICRRAKLQLKLCEA